MSGGDDDLSAAGDLGAGNDLASLRRAFAAGPSRPPAPAECLTAETIWLAVHGELPAGALRAAIDHLAGCPTCAEEWRLAVAFESPPAVDGETYAAPEPERRRRGRRHLAAWLAASGMAATLIAGAGILVRAPVPVLRGGPAPAAAPTPPILLETGGQPVNRDTCFLHWTGAQGASYDVVVRTPSGRVVAHAEGLTVKFYQVPDAKLADLPAGSVLTWQVKATGLGGSSASPTETFSLR